MRSVPFNVIDIPVTFSFILDALSRQTTTWHSALCVPKAAAKRCKGNNPTGGNEIAKKVKGL